MINDDWWTGVIESKVEKNSPFLSIKVQWDSQEMEYMSPWDLEPVDHNSECCVKFKFVLKCNLGELFKNL